MEDTAKQIWRSQWRTKESDGTSYAAGIRMFTVDDEQCTLDVSYLFRLLFLMMNLALFLLLHFTKWDYDLTF